MHYPVYGRTGESRLTLSALSGGLDAGLPDTALDTDRLREVCNLWWKDGALRTRPARRRSNEQWPNLGTVCRQEFLSDPITMDGRRGYLYLAFCRVASGYALAAVLVAEDGEPHPIRTPSEPDWETLPTQLLPIGGNDGAAQLYIDGRPHTLDAEGTLTALEPYVPTVLIAGRAVADYNTAKNMSIAAGTVYEPYNRLTEAFQMDFFLTDDAHYYTLPSFTRHRPGELTVKMKGYMSFNIPFHSTTGEDTISTDRIMDFFVHWAPATGVVWFSDDNGVCTPNTEKWSEISILYRPAEDRPHDLEWVRSMTLATWFGGTAAGLGGGTRCFLAGSTTEPSRLCYSAADNITYLPENNDARVGQAGQAITALKKQADMLVIFKENEIWYSSYLVGTTDSEALTVGLENGTVADIESALAHFPLAPLTSTVGCDRPSTIALCDNRLVWTTREGRVFMLASGNLYSERNAREIGQGIYPLLSACRDKIGAAVDHDGHYLLFAGKQVFLFDYRFAGLAAVGAATSEEALRKRMAWYRWEWTEELCPLFAAEGQYPLLYDGSQVWVIDGEKDERTTPIRTSFRLPLMTVGRIDRQKSVRLAVLDSGQPYAEVTVTPIGDDGYHPGDGRRLTADRHGILRLFPSLRRVGRFALQAEAEGPIAWRDVTFFIQ